MYVCMYVGHHPAIILKGQALEEVDSFSYLVLMALSCVFYRKWSTTHENVSRLPMATHMER